MFKSIAELSLRSTLRDENRHRMKNFLAWDKTEKIALILSKQDNINKHRIDAFTDSLNKYTEVFYIELDSKDATYSDWHCFSKKDKSLLNLPKKGIREALKEKKFDVVINTCQEIEVFSTSLTSALSAPLKCGSTGKYNDVDLIIKKKGFEKVEDYLAEVVRYLKMIKTQ